MEAVETTAPILGAFREAAPDAVDLVQVGRTPACSLDRQLDGEKCVTAVLAEVSAHQVTFLNFGHPSRPMPLRAVGTVDLPNRTPMHCHSPWAPTAPPSRRPTSPALPSDQLPLYTDDRSTTPRPRWKP
ncbi:hypothetical protein ACQPXS_02470 [Streptomyces sp. CA-142005]|uniref:hypothetical protein n=1 Tax=Streptomyces sp. CA-142005 TaxID=3240052 RepID=UPI003D8B7DC5